MNKSTADKIIKIAEQFRLDILIDDERERTFRDEPSTEEYRQDQLICFGGVQSDIREALAYSDYEWIKSIAETVIEENKLSTVREGTHAYQFLCRELLKAFDRALTVQLERWWGRYTEDPLRGVSLSGKWQTSKAVEAATSRASNRPPAKWDALKAQLIVLVSDGEHVSNKNGTINRIETAEKLRDWYRVKYRDEAFNPNKDAAPATIRKKLKSTFDELDASLNKSKTVKR